MCSDKVNVPFTWNRFQKVAGRLRTILGTSKIVARSIQERLLRWIGLHKCFVVVTVRADFYADLMACVAHTSIASCHSLKSTFDGAHFSKRIFLCDVI